MTSRLTASLSDLEERGRLRLESDGRPVLVVLVDGVPYAVEDSCRHRQSSLAEGLLRDGVITCPAHLWQYDVRTGARHDTRGEGLSAFPCRVVGDRIEVDVPDPARQPSLREILLAHAREGLPAETA